jgi:hypothetical protein
MVWWQKPFADLFDWQVHLLLTRRVGMVTLHGLWVKR